MACFLGFVFVSFAFSFFFSSSEKTENCSVFSSLLSTPSFQNPQNKKRFIWISEACFTQEVKLPENKLT